jgi:hypothetical protein
LLAALGGVSVAAMNRAVGDLYAGQRPTISGAYREVRARRMRYLFVGLLAMIYALTPANILIVVISFVHRGSGEKAALGLTFLLLMSLAAGLWMEARYFISVAASITEGVGGHAALNRSVLLTKDARGRILGFMLVCMLAEWALRFAVEVPFRIIGLLSWHPFKAASMWGTLAIEATGLVVSALAAPVYGIAITLIYYDRRMWKEDSEPASLMRPASLSYANDADDFQLPQGQILPGIPLG